INRDGECHDCRKNYRAFLLAEYCAAIWPKNAQHRDKKTGGVRRSRWLCLSSEKARPEMQKNPAICRVFCGSRGDGAAWLTCQNGSPCMAPPMHISIGIDSRKLVRDAYFATVRAFALAASSAGTMPRIFFWFGQISTQTLNSMIVPIHAPRPMTRK